MMVESMAGIDRADPTLEAVTALRQHPRFMLAMRDFMQIPLDLRMTPRLHAATQILVATLHLITVIGARAARAAAESAQAARLPGRARPEARTRHQGS